MKKVHGNLWRFSKTHWILVPTNVGWKLSDNCNIMGRGVALDAKRRFPKLPEWYGEVCQRHPRTMHFVLYNPGRLVLMPTKKFNEREPWMSWQADTDPSYLEEQVAYLAEQNDKYWLLDIALPLVGCGEGGLSPKIVEPILEKYLTSDKYTLVLQ